MTLNGPVKHQLDSTPQMYVLPHGGNSAALVPVTKKQSLPFKQKSKVWHFLGHKLAGLTSMKRKKLLDVVAKGSVADVMEQLAGGADVNVKSSIGQSPLYLAASKGYHHIMVLLLDKGASVNDAALDGTTALYVACENNHELVLKLLLKHKARFDLPALNGLHPIHIAARKGHYEIVDVLLKQKVKYDVVARNSSLTPLMMACMNSHSEIVELLLDVGADPHVEDAEGNTPLHFACAEGNYRSTYLLLTAGADPDMPNTREDTAFDVASTHGHSHVLYLLETMDTAGGAKQVEEMDQAFIQDKQLREALARNRPEISDIIVRNRLKYAKFFALGSVCEDEAVEAFADFA